MMHIGNGDEPNYCTRQLPYNISCSKQQLKPTSINC